MKKILLLILLSLPIFSIAQTADSLSVKDSLITEKEVEPEPPKPEIKKFATYRITVPLGWDIKPGCVENQCTFTSTRDTVGGFDTYIESINLTVNKLNNTSYTALKYANYSIGYLPKVVQNFTVLEKKSLGSNGYRVTYRGLKNGLEQTWRQYYYVRNGKVYIVTFSAETRKYDYYQPLIEPYLNSFSFN